MKTAGGLFLIALPAFLAAPILAQNQIGGGNCSAANLNGSYSLVLGGRAISSAGSFAGSFQGNGRATFDGQGRVTFTGTDNTNLGSGKPFTFSGTYTLPSNCYGMITMTTPSPVTFTLVVWDNGREYNIIGADATYIYSGGGSNFLPACAAATLSGGYAYQASGFTLSGTAQTGAADEAGLLQFDGLGNVTATYTVTSGGTPPVPITATGTYSVTSNCVATATLMDSTGKSNTLTFIITGLHGESASVIDANSQFVRSGSLHSTFTNPSQSIGNVASYAYSATPPGSVFVLFGSGLAARNATAVSTPLPTTLLNTMVLVNGEAAPLFFVDTGQIDAQLPLDIPGGTVASVVVKNGNITSNAAAIYVPGTGTPGISVYGNNRAVVVNQNGAVNAPGAGAKVGDEVVVYFTGGGPVQASGKLTTGAPSPAGLSPVTGSNSITVGGKAAMVVYMGLTPGSIGLYQANFIVPQLPAGTYPVVITIAGQPSNNPVMTVSN